MCARRRLCLSKGAPAVTLVIPSAERARESGILTNTFFALSFVSNISHRPHSDVPACPGRRDTQRKRERVPSFPPSSISYTHTYMRALSLGCIEYKLRLQKESKRKGGSPKCRHGVVVDVVSLGHVANPPHCSLHRVTR